ncbi:hypothetical protein GF325_12820 [Candidatus Bathyarchaeota archaeon]|nr:hypothetical protein [Candidatus Bathyarchaeota archaeon]
MDISKTSFKSRVPIASFFMVLVFLSCVNPSEGWGFSRTKDKGTRFNDFQEKPLNSVPETSQVEPNYTVLDIRGEMLTVAEQLLLASIEGLVNQEDALLYIIEDDLPWGSPSSRVPDEAWLDDLKDHPTRKGHNYTFTNMSQLVNDFSSHFERIIIVNESDPDSWNIATPLCGKHDALLICDDYHEVLVPLLNKSYPIVYNITNIFSSNGLETSQEKYEHAYEHYFQDCHQEKLAVFGNEDHTRRLRGYLISESIFTLSSEFLPIFSRIIEETPANIPVYGCWKLGADNGEGKLVSRLAETGKYIHVSEFMHNIAFFSHFPLPPGYIFEQFREATLPPLEDKMYISAIFSEGDNLQYVQGFMRNVMWSDPNRSKYPVGWSIGPVLGVDMPYLIKYYYDTASPNDLMISGLNGKGYTYPELMSREDLALFIKDSNEQLELLDMQEMTMMKVGENYDMYQHLNVTGFFNGYGFSQYNFPRKVGDIPLSYNLKVGWADDQDAVLEQIFEIQSVNPRRPIFINMHLISWKCNTTQWTRMADILNGTNGITIVRPDQLALLMREANLFTQPVALGLNYALLGLAALAVYISARNKRINTRHERAGMEEDRS